MKKGDNVVKIEDPEMGLSQRDAMETASMHEDSRSESSDGDDVDGASGPSTATNTAMFERRTKNFINDEDGSFIILTVLTIATLVFTVAIYLIVRSNQDKFESEFESYSREFNDMAQSNKDNLFSQLRTATMEITSLSSSRSSSTQGAAAAAAAADASLMIHNYNRRALDITNNTGMDMVLYVPLVEMNQKEDWEADYVVQSQRWIAQDMFYRGLDASSVEPISGRIYEYAASTTALDDGDTKAFNILEEQQEILKQAGYSSSGDSIMAPIAQFGPSLSNSSLAMMDLFTHPIFRKEMLVSLKHNHPVISEPVSDFSFLLDHIIDPTTPPTINTTSNTTARTTMKSYWKDTKKSFLLDPIRETFRGDSKIIGFMIGITSWETFFELRLPPHVNGMDVVVGTSSSSNDCHRQNVAFTYHVNGGKPSKFVDGDQHDSRYDDYSSHHDFDGIHIGSSRTTTTTTTTATTDCSYRLSFYGTDTFRESFDLIDPSIWSGLIVIIFVFFAVMFFVRDLVHQKRQDKALEQAKRMEAIVTSVFPKEIGLRLIEQANQEAAGQLQPAATRKSLNTFLAKTGEIADSQQQRRKPIADLFPNTTVMFADIVGFTAWSSTREPSQVFILLETIYKEFDTLAKQRKVFKVETVGDCYVAVCGLPEPKKDHPVAMSLFAADCLTSMQVQVQSLEEELGPDTADLGIRIGLHSGPVTAGVLRGDRARFQLFGDTVNTCARIETTGDKNKIHLSKETADILTKMGKSHWIMPRNDKVYAKGKGQMQTYWMRQIQTGDGPSIASNDLAVSGHGGMKMDMIGSQRRLSFGGKFKRKHQDLSQKKFDRLVNWNVDVLKTLLIQVEERRELVGTLPEHPASIKVVEDELSTSVAEGGTAAFDEVVESIEIATFNADANRMGQKQHELSSKVQQELRDYVRLMARMYNDNPFHNFEHASHVTMSVMKLLSRIVAPDIEVDESQLHDHTYGITSDPLTQFAVVLSALLHDLDHLGVPNTQLVKELPELSRMYKDKSVAEQNSIDLAWALLMEDRFTNLRRSIYSTTAELRRFRQLVVNTILATDIMDKELKALRNAKWDKAFSQDVTLLDGIMEINNRKATVVIEHLIQASDIAHTMQHWQVYRKWNQRLFREMYRSYREGHADKDPSEGWYEGEIGFFDFYIIPLAKKLDECGVFGVSSHEYLNYAEQNRKEWEMKGESVVAQYIQEIRHEDEMALRERDQL